MTKIRRDCNPIAIRRWPAVGGGGSSGIRWMPDGVREPAWRCGMMASGSDASKKQRVLSVFGDASWSGPINIVMKAAGPEEGSRHGETDECSRAATSALMTGSSEAPNRKRSALIVHSRITSEFAIQGRSKRSRGFKTGKVAAAIGRNGIVTATDCCLEAPATHGCALTTTTTARTQLALKTSGSTRLLPFFLSFLCDRLLVCLP